MNKNKKTVRPIRLFRLEPGSTCTIFAEPSRGLRKVADQRMYRKAFDGFYSTHIATGEGVVLMPYDIVTPFRRKQ